MRIRVLGAGWFGCHLSTALLADGHDVEVHEVGNRIFGGASGNIPARLHLGAPHYPRSFVTQQACQEHQAEFLARYGRFTRAIPVNIYAVAKDHSLIDFGTYKRVLRDQVEFITLYDPTEFGLAYVEGGVMLGERHIVVDDARAYFSEVLDGAIKFNTPIGEVDHPAYDMTIDCSFCANDSAGVDRYEPCLVVLLKGPTDKSVTIVDGPFPSLYVWNEGLGLSSLSSARWTPFSKTCKTWAEARALLNGLSAAEIERQAQFMLGDMAGFYPAVRDLYEIADYRLSIRAMPLSGADTRLVDVARVGERALRIRAGKIDAVLAAEKVVKGMIA
ncbi:hypothetical protein MesoLjLc_50710 [Mesorhizobium sp. L-8-10]|uniref:hypothetical protein n=1 Tax=Mesorhizobium sp. L-8-10 TaxID=2744523 RepID=UPI0019295C38|nr:hypothetical protein [Mesorhizobium sp. L-8-10]BCH33141.1 hypothetical protein MesoLjLc_50710 [Mesorhizobium sp. L-8-10]